MRRLPVFFVLDCSESMIGDNLRNMEEGLQMIVRSLRTDPHALESVWLSVVAFAGIAQTVVPLVEVVSFYPPKLPVGSGTSLGAALRVLMRELDSKVVRTTPARKGDWKPIVYLFTDGKPTDEIEAAITRWNAEYASKATLIAVAFGRHVDLKVLSRLTETVLVFEQSTVDDFRKFVQWVTASVVAQSRSLGAGAGDQPLPALDSSFISLIKADAAGLPDEHCVVLTGRCQKTLRPYVMKYDKVTQQVGTQDFTVQASHYSIAGCYPIGEDYFAWSDPRGSGFQVHTDELLGFPGCPHCGNASAFAMCSCGKLLCVDGPGEGECPWCKKQVRFGNSGAEDSGFDVSRGRG
ncbi:MAG: TerY-C metal binding domain-containing protein [Pseudomonadota bacterium]